MRHVGRHEQAWRLDLRKQKDRVYGREPPAVLPLTNKTVDSLAGRRVALAFGAHANSVADFLALRPAVAPWPLQVSGAAFMAQRMACAVASLGRGGLFCDPMRMGKTRTVLFFILQDLQAQVAQGAPRFVVPYLICCPKSLTSVWLSELRQLLPGGALQVRVVTAATTAAAAAAAAATEDEPCDIVLTTYPSLRIKSCVARLHRVPAYRALFCDEAHELRNQETIAHAEILLLRAAAVWFISGTPVHNDLDNLCAALQVARVGAEAYATDEARAHTLTSVYLRREIGAHLERLPVTWLEFATPQERTYYDDVSAALGESSLHWTKAHALLSLNKLRQLCLSPALVIDELPPAAPLRWWNGDQSDVITAVAAHLLTVDALGGDTALMRSHLAASFTSAQHGASDEAARAAWTYFSEAVRTTQEHMLPPVSTKERFVAKVIAAAERAGEKVVVFSNYRLPLERIAQQCAFRQRPTNDGGCGRQARSAVLVDGTLDDAARSAALQRFGSDASVVVLLITLTLGNAGHDFSCANHVVLSDPWFNPQLELQGVARLMGPRQRRPVSIYRLALRNTVDASVVNIAESKVALAAHHLPPAQRLDAEEEEEEEEEEEDDDAMDISL